MAPKGYCFRRVDSVPPTNPLLSTGYGNWGQSLVEHACCGLCNRDASIELASDWPPVSATSVSSSPLACVVRPRCALELRMQHISDEDEPLSRSRVRHGVLKTIVKNQELPVCPGPCLATNRDLTTAVRHLLHEMKTLISSQNSTRLQCKVDECPREF